MDKTFIPSKVVPNPEGQAKLILTSVGLQFVKPRFFNVDEDRINRETQDFNAFGDPAKKSIFGTPIFDSFSFLPLSYTDNDGKNINITAKFDFDTMLVEINQTKNIVTTSIAGGNGTVKEYVGLQDYSIALTGLIVGKYANVPIDLQVLEPLEQYLNAPISLPFSCAVLDFMNINSLVVMDYKFGQIQGTRNALSVTINCISDTPFEVEYKQNKQFISSGSVPR